MKIKIKNLNPNPFKKELNKGKLNQEQVDVIKSNIKELGLMGSIPIFEKDKKYYIINGHHRVEALKQEFGTDFEVECTLHNYNTENVLRGMIIENLTQRRGDFREELGNIKLIRKHLKATSTGEMARDKFHKGERYTVRVKEVYNWLNKNGEVMSIGAISEILKVADNLDEGLIERIDKSKKGTKIEDEKSLTFSQGVMLSSFKDKKEQKDLATALKKSDVQGRDKQKELIRKYKEAPKEIKKKVREREIDIGDIEIETELEDLNKKYKRLEETENKEIRIITSKEIVNIIREDLLEWDNQLEKILFKLKTISVSKIDWFKEEDKKDFIKLINRFLEHTEKLNNSLNQIRGEVG